METLNWYESNKYMYYSDFVVMPYWEDVESSGVTGLSDIMQNMIDTCCIPVDNEYYKINYTQYACTWTNLFEDIRKKITESEYRLLCNEIGDDDTAESSAGSDDETNADVQTRAPMTVVRDNNKINSWSEDVLNEVQGQCDILYEDDQYKLIVPLSFDNLKYNLRKTFSCFASDSSKRYQGYIDNETVFYIITDKKPAHKSLNTVYAIKSEKHKPYHTYINKNGAPLCYDNYFDAKHGGEISHLKSSLVDDMRMVVDGYVGKYTEDNLNSYLSKVKTNPVHFNNE
jgi:hypothetical protein